MLPDLEEQTDTELCYFTSSVKESLELEVCAVLSGVGNIERRVFQVHCISLSDADPHHYVFPFCTAQTKPGKN